jgi:hypothetical protein
MSFNVDVTIVESESGDKKPALFGWCMDGNDKECIIEFTGYFCKCKCHNDPVIDEK